MRKKFVFIAGIAAILIFSLLPCLPARAAAVCAKRFEVTYGQSEAREMLALINDLRKPENAWYWDSTDTQQVRPTDLQPLTYDCGLEAIAMQRAAEIALSFSHTRPNGSTCFSAFDEYGYDYYTIGENIAAGYPTGESVFVGWCETDDPYAGQGHRRNMLNGSFTSVGVGHVIYNGRHYWTQEFGAPATGAAYAVPLDAQKTVTVPFGDSHTDANGDGVCDLCGSAPLAITKQPVSVAVVPGKTVTFSVAATGTGTLRYQWYYKKPAAGSVWTSLGANFTKASFSYTMAEKYSGIQYYCKITDDNGSVNSNAATVKALPKITKQPVSAAVAPGKTVTFSVTATGAGTLRYQWYYKKPAAGSVWTSLGANFTKASFSYTMAEKYNGIQYYCKITDDNGSVNSNAAKVSTP